MNPIQAHAAMLIRKPVAEVFEAVVNPDTITKYWFTRSSGRLEAGKQVQWMWDMFDMSAPVTVTALEPNQRIVMDFPTRVEWLFTPQGDDATIVSITNSGFSGDQDAIVAQAMNSTAGFTIVLAGMKAYLEHGIQLNLVADRYPERIVTR